MNLKELKSMIAEEYNAYIAEQGVEAPADMPAIQVADTDVDATGGEDAEATLKDIYEMLKAYFEGGADTSADDTSGVDDLDDADVDADEDEEDEAEALQERFKRLANIIKG